MAGEWMLHRLIDVLCRQRYLVETYCWPRKLEERADTLTLQSYDDLCRKYGWDPLREEPLDVTRDEALQERTRILSKHTLSEWDRNRLVALDQILELLPDPSVSEWDRKAMAIIHRAAVSLEKIKYPKLDMLREEQAAAEKKASGTSAAPNNTLYERGRADGLRQAQELFEE